MPGTIVRALRDAESNNPVLMIDEIDKMGADFRGDPASAMLEVLDPQQNASVPRPLPRPALRPVARPVHHDREPAGDDPAAAARPDGDHPARRLHGGREGADREALPRPAPARAERADEGEAGVRAGGAARADRRLHARGGRARARAADRVDLPQGGARPRRGQDAQAHDPQAPGARPARPARSSSRTSAGAPTIRASRPDSRGRRWAATCSSSRRRRSRARASSRSPASSAT